MFAMHTLTTITLVAFVALTSAFLGLVLADTVRAYVADYRQWRYRRLILASVRPEMPARTERPAHQSTTPVGHV